MLRVLSVWILVITLIAPGSAQQIDWQSLFDGAVSRDQAVSAAARDKGLEVILPKLFKDEAKIAVLEIPGLVAQLERKEDLIRQQASGVLAALATVREDSAIVLSPAVSALIAHIQDSVPRIRYNSVSTLSSLKPQIPDSALRFLIQTVSHPDGQLAKEAILGVARMTDHSAEAAQVMEDFLTNPDTEGRRLYAIEAMPVARVQNRSVLSRLGMVLGEKDRNTVKSALIAIQELGPAAIKMNSQEIDRLTSSTTDAEIRDLAQKVLKSRTAQQ